MIQGLPLQKLDSVAHSQSNMDKNQTIYVSYIYMDKLIYTHSYICVYKYV